MLVTSLLRLTWFREKIHTPAEMGNNRVSLERHLFLNKILQKIRVENKLKKLVRLY